LLSVPFASYDFFGYLASGLVAIGGLQLLTGFPSVFGRDLGPFGTATAILAIYVAGQMAATPSKALLEDLLVHRVLRPPSQLLFAANETPRPLVYRLLFPAYHRALPAAIASRARSRAAVASITEIGEPLFLYARFSDRVRGDQATLKKLDVFVGQYGFARNLAFVCLVFGMALLLKARWLHEPNIASYGLSGVVVGVLLVYRFLKFYRQYSFEVFNCFAAGD